MLKNTFAYVFFNFGKGAKWKLNKGSCPGGILSPLLFNFYIKACIEDIVNHDVGCKIGCIKWNLLSYYADDIVLMTPFVKGLQKLMISYENQLKRFV